ncbi:fasciclin-like arabinogalactan protein 11 [Phragmites australis]|uniref:fasciclin-like arabinogalactan protein 11 n=1 Tax=Phragmites australis TaxID=29695 RepID=UPI002D77F9FC|nr:fasciclin-like arabinogalactan protein 11 [Phragmites australis]
MAATRSLLAAAFLALSLPAVLCQAPGPAAPKGPPNVTAILEKGQQYNTFIRLMKATQQDTQLNSQLNNSFNGYTVFAPTDNAFSSLKTGTLNGLSRQEQVSLVQYHIISQFYSMAAFETASNPVRTQASGSNGPYTLNITANSNNQVNISTGVVTTNLGTALRSDQPLAVYSVDKVLLPNDLFGVKPPTSAPPAPTRRPSNGNSSSVAQAPAGATDTPPSGAAAGGARVAGWSLAALLLGAAASLL